MHMCVLVWSLHIFSICKSSHRFAFRSLLEITAQKSVHVCLYEVCARVLTNACVNSFVDVTDYPAGIPLIGFRAKFGTVT